MNIIFAGTAEFALPSLKTLLEHHTVLAVITAPDKPAGRGQKVKPSSVKKTVLEYCKKLPPLFTQPINKLAKQLAQLKPDIIIVAAYGQLLGKEILAIPRFGCLNIHPSLLPKYRGASPIQAAILNGDGETGVTIMQMNEKLDAGPIIAQEKLKLSGAETAGLLHDTLATKSASLLQRILAKIEKTESVGSSLKLGPTPQNHSQATYTQKITARDAQLNVKEPAHLLERKVRAYNPLPGAFLIIQNARCKMPARFALQKQAGGQNDKSKCKILRLKIFAAEIKNDVSASCKNTPYIPLIMYRNFPALVCGDSKLLVLTQVQPEGKKRMSGEEFARGYLIRKSNHP